MNINFSGKVALVTGGSGQLGRVMVRTLAQSGADIIVHYLQNKTKADELVAEVIAEYGVKAFAVQADVTDEASVMAMRDTVVATAGTSPDIIVNNAVIQYKWVSVLEQGVEDYEGQFRSCVLHNVLMAKAFVPAMVEKGWGRVVGINTECAMQNFPGQSAYVSGKRGMDGVMRVLAKEVAAKGVTVNQVAPGWMISDRDRETGREYVESYCEKVPAKRRGTDQDIANAVVFLASEQANFITGVYLPVCGGNVMPCI